MAVESHGGRPAWRLVWTAYECPHDPAPDRFARSFGRQLRNRTSRQVEGTDHTPHLEVSTREAPTAPTCRSVVHWPTSPSSCAICSALVSRRGTTVERPSPYCGDDFVTSEGTRLENHDMSRRANHPPSPRNGLFETAQERRVTRGCTLRLARGLYSVVAGPYRRCLCCFFMRSSRSSIRGTPIQRVLVLGSPYSATLRRANFLSMCNREQLRLSAQPYSGSTREAVSAGDDSEMARHTPSGTGPCGRVPAACARHAKAERSDADRTI